MKANRATFCATALVTLSLAGCSPATVAVVGAGASAPSTASSGDAGQVLALVNQARTQAGCPALTVDGRLTRAAMRHASAMANRGFFSHTGADGSSPARRISDTGYVWNLTGENIAAGQPTAQAAFGTWINSPGHRANILNCGFSQTGLARAQTGDAAATYPTYWVQVFARPAP